MITIGRFFLLMPFVEILPFPAGGSAAVFFISVVLVLAVIKILCVITGYETRVPSARIDTVIEEQKQILIQEESGDERGGSSIDGRGRQSHHECEHHHPPSPLGNCILHSFSTKYVFYLTGFVIYIYM